MRYRLRRTLDDKVLCTDGQWRDVREIIGMLGHPAKTYASKGGAGGAASAIPHATVIEEHI